MARSAPPPSARLKVLHRARAKAAKIRSGETLSAMPMAELLEVRWPALREWCNTFDGFADSGVFEGGGNGVDYVFRPRQTITWLIRHFEKEQAAKSAKARRVRRLVGGGQLAGVPDDYSVDELGKIISVRSKLREERLKDGGLVDAARAQHAVREMFSRMQLAGAQAAQQQDPTGQWPLELREAFDDAIDKFMHAMDVAARDCLKTLRGGAA